MRTEQSRPYTDYQYYYVPENVAPGQQQMPVLRSPLAGRLEQGLAYGNFQIEPDGSVITPNDNADQRQNLTDFDNELFAEALSNRKNIENNLLPALRGIMGGPLKMNLESEIAPQVEPETVEQDQFAKEAVQRDKLSQSYLIESLQSKGQKTQVIEQKRSVLEQNVISNVAAQSQRQIQEGATQAEQITGLYERQTATPDENQTETVQVRIEPFFPVVAPGGQAKGGSASQQAESMFGGQVFLLRHVQIEDRHFLQGFQLNETMLVERIEESASRFVRKGMSFELSPREDARNNGDVAHAAILNFGFGDLVLNLKEIDPDWIGKEIRHLRIWYFSIVAIVLLAVSLGLASLWRNATTQIKLAQKKDDFISAVSHELRTPLTSIRMYSEMLEKNWVKSQDKAVEYGDVRKELGQIAGQGGRILQEHATGKRKAQPADRKCAGLLADPKRAEEIYLQCRRHEQVRCRCGRNDGAIRGTKRLFNQNRAWPVRAIDFRQRCGYTDSRQSVRQRNQIRAQYRGQNHHGPHGKRWPIRLDRGRRSWPRRSSPAAKEDIRAILSLRSRSYARNHRHRFGSGISEEIRRMQNQ
jgi:hypothetical protein